MTDNVDRIAERLTPQLARALREALQDMRDGVDYPALLVALDANDIDGVITALNIEEGSFAPYVAAALAIFMATGVAAARTYGVRFNPTRDAEFRRDLTDKIGAMAAEQVTKAREAVFQGIMDGKPRREIAWELAGRKSKVTGKREGGIIGLSGAQQTWVENMRARLLSGDPVEMRAALKNKDRDKRYDRTIKKAIREGKPLPEAKVDEIVGRYADRLLDKRAKDIAANEATQFAAGAREEAVRQAIAKVPGSTATKTWRHSSIYINARPDHVGMNGRTVAFDANFVMADGVGMRYAHDPRGGTKHNANCRCRTEYKLVRPE